MRRWSVLDLTNELRDRRHGSEKPRFSTFQKEPCLRPLNSLRVCEVERAQVNETPQLGVAGCGRVWLGAAGCGWVWLGLAGFGWVWPVVAVGFRLTSPLGLTEGGI